MIKRPTVVTAICWILIIVSLLGILSVLPVLLDPHKLALVKENLKLAEGHFDLVMSLSIVVPVINIVLAFFMLYGKNWSRYIYLVFNAILYAYTLIAEPIHYSKAIVIVVFLIFIYFLFRKSSSYFFQARSASKP